MRGVWLFCCAVAATAAAAAPHRATAVGGSSAAPAPHHRTGTCVMIAPLALRAAAGGSGDAAQSAAAAAAAARGSRTAALDRDGRLYVCNPALGTVSRVDPRDGRVEVLLRRPRLLRGAADVAVAEDRSAPGGFALFVSNGRTHAVLRIAGRGKAGPGKAAPGGGAQRAGALPLPGCGGAPCVLSVVARAPSLAGAAGIAAAGDGAVYVAVPARNELLRVGRGGALGVFSKSHLLDAPTAVAVDDGGSVFVANGGQAGSVVSIAPTRVAFVFASGSLLRGATGVAVSPSGEVLVSCRAHRRLTLVTQNGRVRALVEGGGAQAGRAPAGAAAGAVAGAAAAAAGAAAAAAAAAAAVAAAAVATVRAHGAALAERGELAAAEAQQAKLARALQAPAGVVFERGGGRALLVDSATGAVLRLGIAARPAPPRPPRIVAAVAGASAGSVAITLAPRAADGGVGGSGGCRLLGLVVCVQPGGREVSVDGAPARIVVEGLVPGRSYDFTVRAVNDAGSSARSAPSPPTRAAGVHGGGAAARAGDAAAGQQRAPLSAAVAAAHQRGAEVLRLVVLAAVGGLAILAVGGTLLWRRVKRKGAAPAPLSFDQFAGYRQFQSDPTLQSALAVGGVQGGGAGYGAQGSARAAGGSGGGRSASPAGDARLAMDDGEESSDEDGEPHFGAMSRLSDDEDDAPIQRFAV